MSGVSEQVSLPQRRDAREAIYEPPDRSLWLYIWEFPNVHLKRKVMREKQSSGVVCPKTKYQTQYRKVMQATETGTFINDVAS